MSSNLYLLWFAQEYVAFRLPEIESIIRLLNIDMKWIDRPSEKPFLVVEFRSEEDAFKLASRSVSLRSVIKLWSYAETLEELHENLKNCPPQKISPYLDSSLSFRVEVVTFGKTFTMKEKVDKIEMFNYLPANGPVKLENPDVNLIYIEYYGLDPRNIPENPYSCYFGVWLVDGQRSLLNKYSLKTRKFIGNTSMDPQLSLFMANQALVKPGDLVMDPFVGSGSLLVAAAHFGGYVLGVDIDFLMLHGKRRPTRKQDRWKSRALDESIYNNMKQYRTESRYLDVIVGDSSLPFWHEKLKMDSIVTDPPYGLREATERIGTTRNYKIRENHIKGHIPSKVDYCLSNIFSDLLTFSVEHLKINGRLVCWIPVLKEHYNESDLPCHPCLRLISNSEQSLNDYTSRRLLTWEKIREANSEDVPRVEQFLSGFREKCFAHGETRKERRMRVAQELKDKGLTYCSRLGGDNAKSHEQQCIGKWGDPWNWDIGPKRRPPLEGVVPGGDFRNHRRKRHSPSVVHSFESGLGTGKSEYLVTDLGNRAGSARKGCGPAVRKREVGFGHYALGRVERDGYLDDHTCDYNMERIIAAGTG